MHTWYMRLKPLGKVEHNKKFIENSSDGTYLRYSEGGTNFRNKDTITIVDVKLSSMELRKNVTNPTWNYKDIALGKNIIVRNVFSFNKI